MMRSLYPLAPIALAICAWFTWTPDTPTELTPNEASLIWGGETDHYEMWLGTTYGCQPTAEAPECTPFLNFVPKLDTPGNWVSYQNPTHCVYYDPLLGAVYCAPLWFYQDCQAGS